MNLIPAPKRGEKERGTTYDPFWEEGVGVKYILDREIEFFWLRGDEFSPADGHENVNKNFYMMFFFYFFLSLLFSLLLVS